MPALLAQEQLELTPADYVSRAIVALSRRKASLGQAFHLFNPATISISDVVARMNAFGYAVRQTTYDAWLGELVRVTEEESGNALVPFAPLFPKKEQERSHVQANGGHAHRRWRRPRGVAQGKGGGRRQGTLTILFHAPLVRFFCNNTRQKANMKNNHFLCFL